MTALLTAQGVTKMFAGITALDDVSIEVGEREIVGLIGPNGAGKTTFFNCLLGLLKLDAGSVRFEGRELSRVPTHKRARLGIARTFQRIELFTGMTPREHFLVAERVRNGRGALWKDLLFLGRPTSAEKERAQNMLDLLGLAPVGDRSVEALSLGVGRLVEIGRETEELAETLRGVQREQGVAILLVEHDVDLVRNLVERVYVLDFGTLIASGPTSSVFADSAVRRAYLGDLV